MCVLKFIFSGLFSKGAGVKFPIAPMGVCVTIKNYLLTIHILIEVYQNQFDNSQVDC